MTGPVALAAMAIAMLAEPAIPEPFMAAPVIAAPVIVAPVIVAPVMAGPCAPVASRLTLSPPIGRPMRLVVTTTRPARDGSMRTFGLEYRLIFEAGGRGLLLTATLVQLNSDKAGGFPAAMQAILGPLVGQPVTYLVSGDGQRLLLQNGDQLWASIARDLSAAAKRADSGKGVAADNLLIQLSPDQREDLLAADMRQLLRFAGRDWTQHYREASDGRAACGQIALVEKAPSPATGALLVTHHRWLVDGGWGLVRQHDEQQSLQRGPGSTAETAAQSRRTLTLIETPAA